MASQSIANKIIDQNTAFVIYSDSARFDFSTISILYLERPSVDGHHGYLTANSDGQCVIQCVMIHTVMIHTAGSLCASQ